MKDPHEQFTFVYNLIMAAWGSQAVRALAHLSVAEHLAAGPRSAESIAEAEASNLRATSRLLRAGVALELLEYDAESDKFASTPALQILHGDSEESLKHYALAAIGPVFWMPAIRLPEAIRTGAPQTSEALGMSTFEYLRDHPDDAAEFALAMSGLSSPVIRMAGDVIDTSHAQMVIDVGGAEGAFAAELLQRNPGLGGAVVELPGQVERIRSEAMRLGLSERLHAVAGDFFESVPVGDVYLLKFILHDWDDEKATRILRVVREAMAPGARGYVVEMLDDGQTVPRGLAYMDMAMLFGLGGQERTVAEYDELFAQAGLERVGVRQLLEPYVCIEVRATPRG